MLDPWKIYLITGISACTSVALTHTLATKYHASCADKWTTLGVAGAIGSFVGAHEVQSGYLLGSLRALIAKVKK